MTVISNKEFATHQEKYFDLALKEQVFVKKGNNMFIFTRANNLETTDEVYEPDEDFYRSIPIDKLHRKVKEDIHQWYKEKNENSSITGSTAIS
jgi:hypothetical protein